MRYIILLLAFACSSACGEDWTPPVNPNPQTILQEAQADTRAKRYETALAKHIWYHENALSINRAQYGVRLSFALSYWHELAKKYPPALTKLKEVRDLAAKNVADGKNVREAFHELASIDKTLGEQSHTKEVFEALDDKSPRTAKEVFDVAQPSLVLSKEYALISKYVTPKDDLRKIIESYGRGKKLADNPQFGTRHLDFVNKKFANDATTLVAILAVNDRKNEAEDIATSARAEWDDRPFHASLDKAIKGIVPDPWP